MAPVSKELADGRIDGPRVRCQRSIATNVENLLPGEAVVFIKPEIVTEAVRRYQAGR